MDPQTWDLIARIAPILVGIVLGGVAVITATSVWGRKQVFGYGGSALCVAGVVLIGLSIWSSVKFTVSPTGGIIFEAGPIKTAGGQPTIENKSITVPNGPTQIGFWTPSRSTKEASDVKPWEIVESDARLDEFADELIGAKIIEGYRRYEVTGAGIGSRKKGAWWVSTNRGKFNLAEFLKAYAKFWKPGEDTTYMEIVTLSSGGYQTYQTPAR